MIKRTRTESKRVTEILSSTKTEHLQCRSARRHLFGTPKVEVELTLGRKPMLLTFHCPECGTIRYDTYLVRVRANFVIDIIEFSSREYVHPEGYAHTADDPAITGMEYMQEFVNRLISGVQV